MRYWSVERSRSRVFGSSPKPLSGRGKSDRERRLGADACRRYAPARAADVEQHRRARHHVADQHRAVGHLLELAGALAQVVDALLWRVDEHLGGRRRHLDRARLEARQAVDRVERGQRGQRAGRSPPSGGGRTARGGGGRDPWAQVGRPGRAPSTARRIRARSSERAKRRNSGSGTRSTRRTATARSRRRTRRPEMTERAVAGDLERAQRDPQRAEVRDVGALAVAGAPAQRAVGAGVRAVVDRDDVVEVARRVAAQPRVGLVDRVPPEPRSARRRWRRSTRACST